MCVLSKKNREKERGKCLICIKICICNSRVKFSICGFRNWWEQATRCTVSSSLSFCIYVHGPCTCMSVLFEICSLLSMGRHRFYAGKYMHEPTSSFHFQSSSTENLVFQFLSVTYFLKFCLCWLLYPDSHIQKELRTEVDFSTKFALF